MFEIEKRRVGWMITFCCLFLGCVDADKVTSPPARTVLLVRASSVSGPAAADAYLAAIERSDAVDPQALVSVADEAGYRHEMTA